MQTLHLDLPAGSMLGKYQIKRLLGHGQSGAAYLAQQLPLGHTVMITMFNFPEEISTQEHNRLTGHFARERAILVRLTHPNILPIYDFGEQAGYIYLVTAFVKGASLGQVLKQQGRFTPQQTFEILKQLAAGLDYAHSSGAVHGILSLSNTLMSNELSVQIAGFGLRTTLEVYGNRQNTSSQAFLYSTSGTFLGSPEYISPERVLGKPADARSDIYALGVMLFELLSGTLPFSGANPLEIALKRIQQPVPSVHAVCPDVPEALDLIISKALDPDPAKRYQSAGDCAATFKSTLQVLGVVERSSTPRAAQGLQLTLPPTVNWFDEAGTPSLTLSSSSENSPQLGTGSGQIYPPAAAHPNNPTERIPANETLASQAGTPPDSMAGIDPFAWWSATSTGPGAPSQTPGTFTPRSPVRMAQSNPRFSRRPAQPGRRRLIKLIALGTVGALTVSGISFAHFSQSLMLSPSRVANAPAAGSTASPASAGNTPTAGATSTTHTTSTTKKTQNTPTPSKTPTAKPSPTSQPTQQPTPKPTQPPQPTPTPGHTATVIGYTNQPTNSSKSFNNPADGQGCLLIRLSNGNFVACERACTHAQVPVDYDSGSGQLVCPAHGAIFDPTHGFSHTSGPGNGPLATVSIRVNGDGTITTG